MVHLVRRINDGAEFAMKIMNFKMMDDKSRTRAENESVLLKKLAGPCVIRYYDNFYDNDYLCILMEYAEGGSLRDVLDEHRNAGKYFETKESKHAFKIVLIFAK